MLVLNFPAFENKKYTAYDRSTETVRVHRPRKNQSERSDLPCHINNYSPKWRWLVVDIYRAAKRWGKYPTLATDTEVNSCFSIY